MQKTLDQKLASIHADPFTSKEFIIADAKDADMGFGVTAPGPQNAKKADTPASAYKSLEDYRRQIREVISQGLVDIMLMSASNLERLAIQEQLFAKSAITPAARANDSSDIWIVRGSNYTEQPSRPFRSATLDHIKYGRLEGDHSQPVRGADLGLYSMTFTNSIEHDHRTLQAFYDFRLEAEQKKFRYFLEVFNPNCNPTEPPKNVGTFLNDHIVRALAGVTSIGRPIFLKIPYNGPESLEELVSYDPHLVVGILGGSAGTTLDAFQLIHDAKNHGARAALFGRKINLSEHPLAFIEMLRLIADGKVEPREAVKLYHDKLAQDKIPAARSIKDDLQLTQFKLHYGGSTKNKKRKR